MSLRRNLFRQREPSTEGGAYRYRTADGNRCVIGYWIDDADYLAILDDRAYFGSTDVLTVIAEDLYGYNLIVALRRRVWMSRAEAFAAC